jgi:hypothetical protein
MDTPCPDHACFPDGWPDGAYAAGCEHGAWTRDLDNPDEGDAVLTLDAETLAGTHFQTLKKMARKYGLDDSGTKEEVVGRLLAAAEAAQGGADE